VRLVANWQAVLRARSVGLMLLAALLGGVEMAVQLRATGDGPDPGRLHRRRALAGMTPRPGPA
jgi:hypothetical protein